MRKIIALILSAAVLFSATACEATRQKIEKNADGSITIVEEKEATPAAKKYSEMTLDEKLEYKASQTLESTTPTDNGMLAPALDSATGKWGYIKFDGSWAIEPQYNACGTFEDGVAPVLNAYSEYIFIKTDGSTYISDIGNKAILGSTHATEGILPVALDLGQDQCKLYYLGNNKTIDATSFPKTGGVKYMNSKYFMVTTQFFGGRAVVMRKTNENLLAETDMAVAAKKNLYQSAYVINNSGEILVTLPAGYDVTDFSLDENGIIIVRDRTNEDAFYGLYDVYGNRITECKYRRIEHCEGDYYLVCDQSGFWGYITKEGKELTGCNFVDAKAFSGDMAAVSDGNAWGAIDTSGNLVIEYEWDSFATLKSAFLDTNIGSAAFAFGIAAAQRGEYWALINTNGEILFAVKAEECPFGNLSGGYVTFKENGLWGLMNISGQKAVEPQFENIGVFGN